jgi:MFS family permease
MIGAGQPSFLEYFDLTTQANATDLIGATNGIFSAGGVIGTLCLPWIADRWGRKWACAVVSIATALNRSWLAE